MWWQKLWPNREVRDTLVTMTLAPTVWALHFLVVYIVAAFECAPNVRIFQPIGGTRITIAVLTAIALLVIAMIGIRAFREWRRRDGSLPHNEATDENREQFLEFSTLLLACLSFVAVIFDALPALFIMDCR